MIRGALFFTVLVIFGLLGAPSASIAAENRTDRLIAALSESGDFRGIILFADGEEITHSTITGFADVAAERAITDKDIWRWASVTKQLVAVLIMQEVDAGRLSLDTPIGEVLPDFDVPTAGDVTVEMLLRHRSGLAAPELHLSQRERLDGPGPLSYCAAEPRISAPGEAFRYNNCDYVVLGAILERLNDKPWARVLRERVLKPAGMNDTLVIQTLSPETITAYTAEGEEEAPIDLSLYGASAGVAGPPADLIKFNAALMDGRLLSQDARAKLFEGDPSQGHVALGAWSFSADLDGCDGPLHLVERRGGIYGVQVRNIIAPDIGRSIVSFTNRGDFAFGEIWTGQGLSYGLASAAFCDIEKDAD